MSKNYRYMRCRECGSRGDVVKAKGGFLMSENSFICKKHLLNNDARPEESQSNNFFSHFLFNTIFNLSTLIKANDLISNEIDSSLASNIHGKDTCTFYLKFLIF